MPGLPRAYGHSPETDIAINRRISGNSGGLFLTFPDDIMYI
jgi:hypothetical protein